MYDVVIERSRDIESEKVKLEIMNGTAHRNRTAADAPSRKPSSNLPKMTDGRKTPDVDEDLVGTRKFHQVLFMIRRLLGKWLVCRPERAGAWQTAT